MAIAPPVLAAGLAGIGQVGSGVLQGLQNRQQRKWNEKMYAQTRQDALADWNMQNEYNSPRAQMQRFQEAGLNPHLIYGQQNMSPTVRAGDTKAWNPQAPQFRPEAALSAYYDTKQANAQLDLMAVQKTVQINNAMLMASKAATEAVKTARSKLELSQAEKLAEGNLQLQQLNLKRMEQEIDLSQRRFVLSLNEDQRRAALNASTLQEAAQRIAESKSRVWWVSKHHYCKKRRIKNSQFQI